MDKTITVAYIAKWTLREIVWIASASLMFCGIVCLMALLRNLIEIRRIQKGYADGDIHQLRYHSAIFALILIGFWLASILLSGIAMAGWWN